MTQNELSTLSNIISNLKKNFKFNREEKKELEEILNQENPDLISIYEYFTECSLEDTYKHKWVNLSIWVPRKLAEIASSRFNTLDLDGRLLTAYTNMYESKPSIISSFMTQIDGLISELDVFLSSGGTESLERESIIELNRRSIENQYSYLREELNRNKYIHALSILDKYFEYSGFYKYANKADTFSHFQRLIRIFNN